jgi:hypothetical protein
VLNVVTKHTINRDGARILVCSSPPKSALSYPQSLNVATSSKVSKISRAESLEALIGGFFVPAIHLVGRVLLAECYSIISNSPGAKQDNDRFRRLATMDRRPGPRR